MNDGNCVKQLTFGVAFNNMFKLLDSWGEIADDLLYKNKYFSPEFFSQISSQYTTERRLFNPEKQHFFVLTANNLVFTQTIETSFNDDYAQFKKRVIDHIIPHILSRYSLVVRRLGMVFTCEWRDDQIKNFASKYFNPSVTNIMDFRFSKKEATTKGAVLADNEDFVNKIFTVGNLSDGIKGISYDYQAHFNPLRQDVRDIAGSFFTDSLAGFNADVINSSGG